MSKFEYRTTVGGYYPRMLADDPVEPEGEGWELISACAADGLILWTWRRPLGQQRIAEAVEIADMMRGTGEK